MIPETVTKIYLTAKEAMLIADCSKSVLDNICPNRHGKYHVKDINNLIYFRKNGTKPTCPRAEYFREYNKNRKKICTVA